MTIDIKAIRERESKATKGPWYRTDVEAGYPCIAHEHHDLYRQESSFEPQEVAPGFTMGAVVGRNVSVGCYLGERPDADFIAHAKADVPALLSALQKYGGHKRKCPRFLTLSVECDCGWQEIQEALR